MRSACRFSLIFISIAAHSAPLAAELPRLDGDGGPLPADAIVRFGTRRHLVPLLEDLVFQDNATFATISQHGFYQVWNRADGTCRETVKLPGSPVAISPDASKVILSLITDELAIWDSKSRKILWGFGGDSSSTWHERGRFSGDGKYWCDSVIADGKKVGRRVDLEARRSTTFGEFDPESEVNVYPNRDGSTVLAGNERNFIAWDGRAGRLLHSFGIGFARFAGSDGDTYHTYDHRARLLKRYDSRSGLCREEQVLPSFVPTYLKLTHLLDGLYLLDNSEYSVGDIHQPRACLWDGKHRRIGPALNDVSRLFPTPDGQFIAYHNSGFWREWSNRKHDAGLDPGLPGCDICDLQWNPSGTLLASQSSRGRRLIWGCDSTRPIAVLPNARGYSQTYALGWQKDGRIWWTDGPDLFQRDLASGKTNFRADALGFVERDRLDSPVAEDPDRLWCRTTYLDNRPGVITYLGRPGRNDIEMPFLRDGQFHLSGETLWHGGGGVDVNSHLAYPPLQGVAADCRIYACGCYGNGRWGVATNLANSPKSEIATCIVEVASGKPIFQSAGFLYCRVTRSGRLMAIEREDSIQIVDVLTGRLLKSWGADVFGPLHPRGSGIAFDPAGTKLAIALTGGSILVMNVTTPSAEPFFPNSKEAELWHKLADPDALVAHRAMADLAMRDEAAVAFLATQLKPEEAPPTDKVQALISKLGSPKFREREAAARDLRALELAVLPDLRAALARQPAPDAEVKSRLESMVKEMPVWDEKSTLPAVACPPDGELRKVRALQVLERIGTPKARELIARLAEGRPLMRQTIEAKKIMDASGR